MGEQTAAVKELSAGFEGIRVQSDQAARAAIEQARTMKELSKAADRTSREIRGVAKANKEQSAGAAKLAVQLGDVRRITERNAEGVGKARGGTADLLKQAQALSSLMDAKPKARSNGRRR